MGGDKEIDIDAESVKGHQDMIAFYSIVVTMFVASKNKGGVVHV